MYLLARFLLIVGFALSAALPVHAGSAELQSLVKDYERFSRAQDPIRSAQRGDVDAATRWPDDTPEAVAERKRALEDFRARLDRLAKTDLDAAEALERDVLADRVVTALDGLAFDEERMPFISGEGFFVNPDYTAAFTALTSEAEAERWLTRIAAFPDYYDAQIANMRRGIKSGFTQPRLVVDNALKTARAQAALPAEQSPLVDPFRKMSEPVNAAVRDKLLARGLDLVRTNVKPAQHALVDFLEREYAPAARKELGARSLPDGERYYRYVVARHTTTTMTPDEIHAQGLKEVARIRGECRRRSRRAASRATSLRS
jgi:uncharacterized protein (DUF885 family)